MGTILYIHGMGGGVDSRTPRALNELLEGAPVVIRNYDFNPAVALPQIESWVDELHPSLIISESMGANYALLVGRGIPHIYLSPAFGAPGRIAAFSRLALVPGVPWLLGRYFKPRPGERQKLDFHYGIIRNFRHLDRQVKAALEEQLTKRPDNEDADKAHRESVLTCRADQPAGDYAAEMAEAWFGSRDRYLKSGIVSIKQWQHFFGEKHCHVDDGAHFWEKDRVVSAGLDRRVSTLAGVPLRRR